MKCLFPKWKYPLHGLEGDLSKEGAVRRRGERQRDFRKEVEAAKPPAVAGAKAVCPRQGLSAQLTGVKIDKALAQQVLISTKTALSIAESRFCGDGRSRTAVQTTYQIAFYTLILPLIVG